MRTVSSLSFDFNKLEVTVEMEGKKLKLTGSLEQGECKMMTGTKLQANHTTLLNPSCGKGRTRG